MDCFNKLKIISFLLLFFISNNIYAAWTSTGRFATYNIEAVLRQPSRSMEHLLLDAEFKGTDKKGIAVYVPKKVPISKLAVGKIMKKVAFGPLGTAVSVAMEAANWIRDETTNDYTKTVTLPNPEPTEYIGGFYYGICHVNPSNPNTNCPTVEQYKTNCQNWYAPLGYAYNECYLIDQGNNHYKAYKYPIGYDPNGTSQQLEYATPEDYANELPQLTDQQVKDLFTDPQTFEPNSNTNLDDAPFPETDTSPSMDEDPFRATERFLDDWWNAFEDDDPLTDPDTITDPTETDPANPKDDPSASYEESTFDLCAEYPEILACQQLGEAEESEPVEEFEVPFSYDPVTLASNATCPQPLTFTLLTDSKTYTISRQPICDFAQSIQPLIISICTIVGIYILSGGIRNG